MPTYATPDPITTTIRIASGDVRIEASDRTDTVVDVTPGNPAHEPDVDTAERIRVEYADGTLRVLGPKSGSAGLLRKPGTVNVVLKVPTGTHVEAATGLGRVSATGRLGDCRIRSGAGDLVFGDASMLDLVTGLGTVSGGRVLGDATCTTGSGGVRVEHVDGRAHVKNSNGDTWLGEAGSGLRIKASNGSVRVDRVRGDARVTTANGDIRVGTAGTGAVDLRTGLGSIDVGIGRGTAARLDLHTSFGSVVNALEPTTGPTAGESTVEITAQTGAGDIVVHRALEAVEANDA
jgi:DUF4097 and DUF4098 domain-containing protein YvlB